MTKMPTVAIWVADAQISSTDSGESSSFIVGTWSYTRHRKEILRSSNALGVLLTMSLAHFLELLRHRQYHFRAFNCEDQLGHGSELFACTSSSDATIVVGLRSRAQCAW